MFFAEHIFFVIGSIKLPLKSGYDTKESGHAKLKKAPWSLFCLAMNLTGKKEMCCTEEKQQKQVTENNCYTAKCLLLMFSLTSCVQTHRMTLKMSQITKIKQNSQDEQKHLKSFFVIIQKVQSVTSKMDR